MEGVAVATKYLIVESGLSKPANQLIVNGYKPW